MTHRRPVSDRTAGRRSRSGSRSAASSSSRSSGARRRWCTARRSRSSAPDDDRSTRSATTTRSPRPRCWHAGIVGTPRRRPVRGLAVAQARVRPAHRPVPRRPARVRAGLRRQGGRGRRAGRPPQGSTAASPREGPREVWSSESARSSGGRSRAERYARRRARWRCRALAAAGEARGRRWWWPRPRPARRRRPTARPRPRRGGGRAAGGCRSPGPRRCRSRSRPRAPGGRSPSSRAAPEAPAHAGSAVPKLRAEVAEPGGREQRVARGVRGDVGVGVALEALRLVGPGQPGQVERDAVDEPVHVGADADAGQPVGCCVTRRSCLSHNRTR